MGNPFSSWAKGIAFEEDYWFRWLDSKGMGYTDDWLVKTLPDAELDSEIQATLRASGLGREGTDGKIGYRILDVGAGPLSPMGKIMGDANVEIVPTDPLAIVYDQILARVGYTPIIRTQFAPAEDLSCFFPPSSFDLIYCANALDHSFEPFRGIVEMLRVLKPGGTIILRHSINEAENENYSGFHQHNFDIQDGKFIIWNRSGRIIVDDALPVACKCFHRVEGYLRTNIRKISEFDSPVTIGELQSRITRLYSGMISAMAGINTSN